MTSRGDCGASYSRLWWTLSRYTWRLEWCLYRTIAYSNDAEWMTWTIVDRRVYSRQFVRAAILPRKKRELQFTIVYLVLLSSLLYLKIPSVTNNDYNFTKRTRKTLHILSWCNGIVYSIVDEGQEKLVSTMKEPYIIRMSNTSSGYLL